MMSPEKLRELVARDIIRTEVGLCEWEAKLTKDEFIEWEAERIREYESQPHHEEYMMNLSLAMDALEEHIRYDMMKEEMKSKSLFYKIRNNA